MAEDGSGDVILRLYEAKKASGPTVLKVNLPFSKVYLTDMLENVREELEWNGNGIKLYFKAFEVKTIRIKK